MKKLTLVILVIVMMMAVTVTAFAQEPLPAPTATNVACSLGFWKNRTEYGLGRTVNFESFFNAPLPDPPPPYRSMEEVSKQPGGGLRGLEKQAATAFINAVTFPGMFALSDLNELLYWYQVGLTNKTLEREVTLALNIINTYNAFGEDACPPIDTIPLSP